MMHSQIANERPHEVVLAKKSVNPITILNRESLSAYWVADSNTCIENILWITDIEEIMIDNANLSTAWIIVHHHWLPSNDCFF